MKSYTDLEQSKVLSKILPSESADMHYARIEDDYEMCQWTAYLSPIPKICAVYVENLPCWSLATLLDIIPYGQVNKMAEDNNKYEAVSWSETDFDPILSVEGFDTPVDACYELILKLHERNLL